MLGLNRYAVFISDPNLGWARAYEKFASEIRNVTTELELEIEHIGSTAVPGLAAKPIIDVGILLDDSARFDDLVNCLSRINLIYRGDKAPVGGRFFVRESAPAFRTHHIHVYFRGAPEWEKYLTFRERLRASATLRTEYSALKRELAMKYRDDRSGYIKAKTDFVVGVLSARDSA